MSDWRDENEFRYVVFSKTRNSLYLKFHDSLVGIIFGENTDEKDIQNIMTLTEPLGIKYMGLKWKNCSPWYDYGNLRYISGIKNSPWNKLIKKV